jgi:dipeptidyl aminopeptidase/acylaminoacyl peptidase
MPTNSPVRRKRPLGAILLSWGILWILAWALATTAAAAQARHPITVEDMWAVKRPGAPSLSPDGRWAAVELTAYDMKENTSTSDIWLLSTDGSFQRRLTTNPARDTSPVWSPDGKWIAFLSKRESDEQTQIYLISPEGGEARRLTKLPAGASALKWFPDSKRIACLSWVWPDLTTDEEQAKRLKEQQDAKVKAYIIDTTSFRYWDHWLADGRVPHLFVVDVETGKHRDVFAGTGLSLVRQDPSADSYDISPDGNEIAFTTDLGKDPGFDPNEDIVTIPAGGGKWTNITADNPANDTNPRYSPNGKWIAYTRQTIKWFYADQRRIVLYDRATAAKRVVTENWDRSADSPIWSSDSQRLYFTAEDKARQPIWVLPINGSPQPVSQGGTNSNLAHSADGRSLTFLRTTMGMPPAVYATGSDGTGARKIETFNDELTAQWQLGEVKEVTYKGWGGDPVQMWVIYPPGFNPKKKWPLLQIVHGGPHGAWMDQFHFRWNMHLFASRGYVVSAVNFHSSTGWGQAFTDSTTGDYGRRELEDVEKGTDFLLAQGYIDPARLAAAGGSFGGYMMAWMNGHTTRYKAMVCHAGVYDWVAQMASDVVRGRDRALGGFPWEKPQKVLEQSAHSYAKSFKTPTLVVHNQQDFRVPVTQGFEYYTTLRMLGVASRLLYFPDENHFVLKPQNSLLWYNEFFNWIGKYAAAGPS